MISLLARIFGVLMVSLFIGESHCFVEITQSYYKSIHEEVLIFSTAMLHLSNCLSKWR